MRGARTSWAAALGLMGMMTAQSAWAADPAPPPPPVPPPPPPAAPAPAQAAIAAAPLTPVPAPTPSEIRYRRMSVDVEATKPNAVIERRVTVKESAGAWLVFPWKSQEATWEQVCVAPCRAADLDRYSTYRVSSANKISSSRPFTLPQGGDAVKLKIDAGNLVAHRAGQSMTAIGGAALIVGAVLVTVAPTIDKEQREHDYRVGGWITGASGLVLMAIGIPLALMTSTTVYADNELRIAKEPAKPHLTVNGFVF